MHIMAVEFNNQPSVQRARIKQKKQPFMVRKLIEWGLAKNEKTANVWLTIIALLFLISSLFFWF